MMVQAYRRNNTCFDKNGDIVLTPATCQITMVLNDTWEMKLTHPLDEEGRWEYLEEEGVIAAPTFQGDKQLFRIHEMEKTDTEVSVVAYPIFYDSANDCFLMDVRPEVKNGQQALDIMTAGTKYSGESDITTGSTAYFVKRNLMDAINGKDEPTFVQRWGGEILYDNYKIIINDRVGGRYGTEIRYGKNMDGIKYHLDMSDVITRIVPVAYNGHMLYGEEPWVDSSNINKYAKIYTKEVKFDDIKLTEDAQEDELSYGTIEELRAALIKKCEEMFDAGADIPSVTIEINMIDLSYTDEYKSFKILETIGLGDTVTCYHSGLGISTESRVIELEWDGILNKPGKVKLGDFGYNYFSELESALNAVNKVIGPGDTLIADRVKGTLNAINTQLRYQKNIAQRQDVRAILFEDTDISSPNYGAMCLGTQGFQIANRRTQDGRDWDWSTAFTAQGGYADTLIAGLLSDRTGQSFWNLDTGEMQLTGIFQQYDIDGKKSVDISNNQIRFFDWNAEGDYVGSIGAVKRKNDGRVGIEMWCDYGDMVWIGYDNGTGHDDHIQPIFYYDSKKPSETPWIRNTVSGTLYIPNQLAWTTNNGYVTDIRISSNVAVTVENGAIKGWKIEKT